MPTRKIADIDPQDYCTHPDHKPAGYRVYQPGIYEHTCAGCGKVTVFRVEPVRYESRYAGDLPSTEQFRQGLINSTARDSMSGKADAG